MSVKTRCKNTVFDRIVFVLCCIVGKIARFENSMAAKTFLGNVVSIIWYIKDNVVILRHIF